MTSADVLAGLVRTPDHLTERNLPYWAGDRYDTEVLVRLAVQRLWITAGTYAAGVSSTPSLYSLCKSYIQVRGGANDEAVDRLG